MTPTERYEQCRVRALALRREEPTLPATAIAERLRVSPKSVHNWLRDAGLSNGRISRDWGCDP